MRRAVFDSSVLISAFLTGRSLGCAAHLCDAEGAFTLVLAPKIIAETRQKLLTSIRLRARYAYTDERAHTFCSGLLRISEIVSDLPPITGVVRDPNDDMIVACAVKGRAEHIVTRDQDLLSMQSYQGIANFTPEEFRKLLGIS